MRKRLSDFIRSESAFVARARLKMRRKMAKLGVIKYGDKVWKKRAAMDKRNA